MSQSKHLNISKNRVSKIVGIQFSLLSPEEILNSSVAQITNRDTYINNKPVIGGLFDPRMGVLEPGLICPTDGLDYMQTPGYFGHIELAKPVFYIQYLSSVIKILRCVCFKCSKLLISKEKYDYFLKLPANERWEAVFAQASKIKRCGEDTEDGCGCKQPSKIKKEGLSNLFAEWETSEEESEKMVIKLTPEVILKIFKRISDDDVNFMGYSSRWSRPDWMICQVLSIPPPAVRPSVKHDAQQRSEDDISHIIVNVIKANKTLAEKIEQGANSNIIEDWNTVLQYYIATLVDNKIPGVACCAQRSGRPLKSIKERLNGKTGRVRGNLMGKRVDFSARSVITPDPNLKISELGIPLKIAKNITKPVIVTENNMNYLLTLIKNGPDKYPGAKILEKKNGDNISLRYIDRDSVKLELGDKVHRHMLDGDNILFNRQPTLHRMSMMCHKAKIMKQGDTFRMNVADTKPYNADFDGDEMNLHMPQDDEAEVELQELACVPNQIISPANNRSIIGIFQDSLLGAYKFTRDSEMFDELHTMNLLVYVNDINTKNIKMKKKNTSFDILSQIMPNISMKYKTKNFNDDVDDYSTSSNVLEIKNGHFIRGQLDKGALGGGGKGLLQRICNVYGNHSGADFIDNLQNIITEYMKTSCYSVGISDLISNEKTNQLISETLLEKKEEVKNLINKTQLGIFENKTGKSNLEEFESQVNNILNNANTQAGKIGRENLNVNNRFVFMVNAGSKGSDLNISQMISCLGQQNVDGKRIPYAFDNRTLPHFNRYDDSPQARGFVESSFISGLSPTELFFHAQGGRVGLIDTAVKTSQTGYIQRRLIKSLEDLIKCYDSTVRNNKNKIIQYSYGDDNIDPQKTEDQIIPFINMNIDETYLYFNLPNNSNNNNDLYMHIFNKNTFKRSKLQEKDLLIKIKFYTQFIINSKKDIIDKVFNNVDSKMQVHIPVSFKFIIDDIVGIHNLNNNSTIDITLLEAYQLIELYYQKLESILLAPPTKLFKCCYYYFLNPIVLLINKRINKKILIILLEEIILRYKQSIVAPGEMVGMVAAQSIGEPTTQLTLNTFHFAGVASKSNVTRGVPRIEEILSLSENPKNPSMTIYIKGDEKYDKQKTINYIHQLEHSKLNDLVDNISICFEPHDDFTNIDDDKYLIQQYNLFKNMFDGCKNDNKSFKSKWIIRIVFDRSMLFEKDITLDDISFALNDAYKGDIECVYSDLNDENLIFRIRLTNLSSSSKKKIQKPLDQSDEIFMLKNLQDNLLNNIVIRGTKKINKVILRKLPNHIEYINGVLTKKDCYVLDTIGTNLSEILALNFIDTKKTTTNDIQEIYKTLGIEAARNAIFNEISEVIEYDGTYINYHHLALLADRMTCSHHMISVFRHGINNDNIGPIAKASFEETPEQFLKAARHAECDIMTGVSANIMVGQHGYFGTSAFQIVLDIDKVKTLTQYTQYQNIDVQNTINQQFQNVEDPNNNCSMNNIKIHNNLNNNQPKNLGIDDDYLPEF